MAARREDLPSRCLSLLEEVKDLIETHNSEQSCSENSSESGQRVSLPSSALPQAQTSTNQQRVMQNFCSFFAPYVTGASSCRPPPAKKAQGYFQVKETWTHNFFCLASTSAECVPRRPEKMALQNAGLGRKKSYFQGKTGECLPKIKRCWRFWIAEDGLSKCKAFPNQSPSWRIFYACPVGYCGTCPGTSLHKGTPNGPWHVSGWKCSAAWAGMCLPCSNS